MTSAPCVTSGSSPASLMIPASAYPAPAASWASAKAGCWPPGSVMVTGSANVPSSSAASADFVAAVAQAPVVQPRLSGLPSGRGASEGFMVAFLTPAQEQMHERQRHCHRRAALRLRQDAGDAR